MKLHVLFLSALLLGCCGLMDMHNICRQASDPDVKDKCMSSLALSDRNIAECGEVSNATMREYCIMRVAIITLDTSKCAQIQTSLMDQCTKVVERIRQNNSFACAGIADKDTLEVCRIRAG
ncbi:MAG: hypothetical protein NT130_00230 [Candidatus Micrarchaeota archaeon]|nr:hypothetical protein [Candidatus Micrarchaeota archaeon]